VLYSVPVGDVVTDASRLPYGLAACAWTASAKTATAMAAQVQTGMTTINHFGLALPHMPFGGITDSGYGSKGGADAPGAHAVYQ
jgi:succinate-semialdehyde dehydrogenase/glutarate-semialdehyde dehydrogenase